jgi:hypothetical protein
MDDQTNDRGKIFSGPRPHVTDFGYRVIVLAAQRDVDELHVEHGDQRRGDTASDFTGRVVTAGRLASATKSRMEWRSSAVASVSDSLRFMCYHGDAASQPP